MFLLLLLLCEHLLIPHENKICEQAHNLMAGPASQAFLGRIVSMSGILSDEKRNRMNQSWSVSQTEFIIIDFVYLNTRIVIS